MTRVGLTLVPLLLAGCVKTVVACAHDGGGVCPSSDLGLCRAEQLRVSEGSCARDADCRLARLPANCAGYARCHAVSVNRLTGTRFENEVLPLIEAACGTASCEVEWVCPSDALRSICVEGTCQVKIIDFDAGFAGGVDECDLVDPLFYCPHEENEECRLERLRRAHAGCTSGADCSLVTLAQNCISYGSCSGVAVSDVAGFRDAAQASLATYCASSSCQASGVCVPFTSVGCVQGLCRPGFSDGGP